MFTPVQQSLILVQCWSVITLNQSISGNQSQTSPLCQFSKSIKRRKKRVSPSSMAFFSGKLKCLHWTCGSGLWFTDQDWMDGFEHQSECEPLNVSPCTCRLKVKFSGGPLSVSFVTQLIFLSLQIKTDPSGSSRLGDRWCSLLHYSGGHCEKYLQEGKRLNRKWIYCMHTEYYRTLDTKHGQNMLQFIPRGTWISESNFFQYLINVRHFTHIH